MITSPRPNTPDSPFYDPARDVGAALSAISNKKLGGFCNQLYSAGGGPGDPPEDEDQEFVEQEPNEDQKSIEDQKSSVQPRGHSSYSYNSNQNSNSPGSSHSSSYTNNNGRITGVVSGTGPGGQPYSYRFGNTENQGDRGQNLNVDYSSQEGPGGGDRVNYNINGIPVPRALSRFTPGTIQKACAVVIGGLGCVSSSVICRELASGGEERGELRVAEREEDNNMIKKLANSSTSFSPTPPQTIPPSSRPRVFFRNVYYGYGTDIVSHLKLSYSAITI